MPSDLTIETSCNIDFCAHKMTLHDIFTLDIYSIEELNQGTFLDMLALISERFNVVSAILQFPTFEELIFTKR